MMTAGRKIFFVPVGTSIVTNHHGLTIDYDKIEMDDLKKNIKFIIERSLTMGIDSARSNHPQEPDLYPAEVSSLYCYLKDHKDALCSDTTIFLLHSPQKGALCAQGVQLLIENKLSKALGTSKTFNVALVELEGLDPNDSVQFTGAMSKLATVINEKIAGPSNISTVYLNITGGYKAVAPYLAILGTVLGDRVTIFYLHERSNDILELPVYPIAFDLMGWRDLRSLILPLEDKFPLSNAQKDIFYNALSKSRLSGLMEKTSPHGLNPVGKFMDDYYTKKRGRALSEFGEGTLLLDRFVDSDYGTYLAEKCVPRWRHLSTGDHIPETVEHGRGHVQRLLELALQLIVSAKIDLSDDQLFVLIASIWLHDLGHSGDVFTCEGDSGIVQNNENKSETTPFYCYGKPDDIRKYHNFLSYDLIKNNRDFLFPDLGKTKIKEKQLKSIELACLYHRRAMPVKNGKTVNKCYITKGICDFTSSEVIEGFSLVAGLLRFLDGAENQEERTGSDEYYEVMKWVIERQVESLKKHPEYNDINSRVRRDADFKSIQPDHFEKHRLVKNVFFAMEGQRIVKGLYGDDKSPNIIGVYFVANSGKHGYDKNKLVSNIIIDFYDEFDLVKALLPFKIILVLVEEYCKKQVIINTPYTLEDME